MNKKLLPVILALILILSVVFVISGCNKDEEVGYVPNESTDVTPETEKSTENSTEADKTEATTADKEAESTKENKTEAESTSKAEGTTTEHTSGSNEPVTCDVCGYEIIKDTGKGDISVGKYCDGKCDEWYGEFE